MRVRNISVLAVLIVLSLVLSLSAAAQSTPRAAPSNDDFINRRTILPGKSHTVTNIHEATVEANQPVPICGTIYNSVWYTFTVTEITDIHLSTAGSLLRTALDDSIDTVIAVYTGNDIFTLSAFACNDTAGSPYAELAMTAASNVAYHVLVGAGENDVLISGSTLVLDTRVSETGWLPPNYDFELPVTSADWKEKNPTGDARVCSTPATPAFIGSCAYAFVGNAAEASGLKLTMQVPTHFAPRKGGTVVVVGFVRVLNAPLGSAKIKFKVTYSDGTPTSVGIVNLTGAAVMANYTKVSRSIILTSKAVDKVQVQVVFNSTTGTLMLDYFNMGYQAGVITRGAAPLALPPAPQGM